MAEEKCDSFNSWELNGLNSLDLWDYTVELECLQGTEDLQLAAELGKTLLERNKELETALRQHQNVIEDQSQEIEYLSKQTVALREVNDSRLKIYEQLEVSIQDLERANHRLAVEHASDKNKIKSLTANIETLESRCEELQRTIDDLNAQIDILKKRLEKRPEPPDDKPNTKPPEQVVKKVEIKCSTPIKSVPTLPLILPQEHEDLMRLSDELRESKVAFTQEHRRVVELEEQLASIVQENNRLHGQLRGCHQREDEPKSMHEEFSILEEVRQGQLCVRCLRGIGDDMSSIMDGDEDDRSGISSLVMAANPDKSSDRSQVEKFIKFETAKEKLLQGIWANDKESTDNPYRDLVQKYEALLEVQLSQAKNDRKDKVTIAGTNQSGSVSLQEELQNSGDYSQFSIKDTDEESGHCEEHKDSTTIQKTEKNEAVSRKKFTQTPDFSEAETSSSGFSDETSNKATQTERERPGAFLCTIADGEDYLFSIYDDASPMMDSRFRNRPEYRELFKEIFTILKKAAENKDEGEKLPLLDDNAPIKVPPVTPANEEPPGNFTDETQSIFSSVMSEQSLPFSDTTAPDTPTHTEIKKEDKENVPVEDKTLTDEINESKTTGAIEKPKEKVLTPLVRQPLDYITATRKKSRHRRKHSQERQGADSPVFPSPPKITYQKSTGKKRRDFKPMQTSPLAKNTENGEWNGSTMQFYNRSVNSPTPSTSGRSGKVYQSWNPETDSWDMKQSTASQEIHQLRKLELSYAEVLKNAEKTKGRRKKHQ